MTDEFDDLGEDDPAERHHGDPYKYDTFADDPAPPDDPAILLALNRVAYTVHMLNVYAAHLSGTGEPGRFRASRADAERRERHRSALAAELIGFAADIGDACRNLQAVISASLEADEDGAT
jgi:hypothetical protein